MTFLKLLARPSSCCHGLIYRVLFQNMIDLAMSTPIQDESVYQFPLDLVSQLLQEVSVFMHHIHKYIKDSVEKCVWLPDVDAFVLGVSWSPTCESANRWCESDYFFLRFAKNHRRMENNDEKAHLRMCTQRNCCFCLSASDTCSLQK